MAATVFSFASFATSALAIRALALRAVEFGADARPSEACLLCRDWAKLKKKKRKKKKRKEKKGKATTGLTPEAWTSLKK